MSVHVAMTAALERLARAFPNAVFDRRDGYAFLAYPSFPIPFINGMWAENDAAAQYIEEASADAERMGTPFTIMVLDGHTPAVEDAARALGYTEALRMPGMVATRDDFTDAHVAALAVTPCSSRSDLDESMAMAQEAFDLPPEWAAAAYSPEVVALDGLQFYLGRRNGRAVATAMGLTVGDAVGIFNVATPVADRGRGYGSAVTAQAVRDGFDRGARYAALQSTAIGESVYRRLGFEEIETYVAFILKS
jgi:ribosomal protein S18 acetylase RimI-like enzyme